MKKLVKELNNSGFHATKIGNEILVRVYEGRDFEAEVDRAEKIINRYQPKEKAVIYRDECGW